MKKYDVDFPVRRNGKVVRTGQINLSDKEAKGLRACGAVTPSTEQPAAKKAPAKKKAAAKKPAGQKAKADKPAG